MMTRAWTDGGCKNGLGSWACLIETPDGRAFSFAGFEKDTTNNRMELMAAIMVIRQLPRFGDVRLFADSQYVIYGAQEWSVTWKAHGWKTKEGRKVKNVDLWEELLVLIKIRPVEWAWVRGHADNHGNTIVDRLAKEARKLAEGL